MNTKWILFLTLSQLFAGVFVSCDARKVRPEARDIIQKVEEISNAKDPVKEKRNGRSERYDDADRVSWSRDVDKNRWQEVGTPTGSGGQIVWHTGYTTCFNHQYKVPDWVMWHLTPDHVTGPYKRNGVQFQPDDQISGCPTTYDYQRSGYDRGHMCPSGDNKWSKTAQYESFYLSNACPQNHHLNSGDWRKLEELCREMVKRRGELYIVAGPIFEGTPKRRIGQAKVAVPDGFFKVLYSPKAQQAIGFVYPNTDTDQPMRTYRRSVDEVERITGLDFFPNVPKDIQDEMEKAEKFYLSK